MHKKIILVDMDGVLADFEAGFLKIWKRRFPHHPQTLEKRKTFRLADSLPNGLNQDIRSVLSSPGFFANLKPIPRAKEALEKMQKLGHEVLICTSPISEYENCVLGKYRWVAKNLGFDWTKKVIMTKDKTLIFGNILIDDKPEYKGMRKPAWIHALFDAPYNRHAKTKLRITWKNWEKILDI